MQIVNTLREKKEYKTIIIKTTNSQELNVSEGEKMLKE